MRNGRSITVLTAGAMLVLAACGGGGSEQGPDETGAMSPTDSAALSSQGAPIDPSAGTGNSQMGADGGTGTADGTVSPGGGAANPSAPTATPTS